MKKFKVLILILVLILLCGCGTKKENNNNNNEEPKQEEPIVEKEENNNNVYESTTRPYAVMINTHNASLPQCGLDKAYIVYELMVEGGITRMMALFRDIESDKIGSIRSARNQYLGYVFENDAIYVHAGGSKEALERISKERIEDIDVDGKYGVRDPSLNRAYEHTLFTTTSLLKTATTNKKFKTETTVGNLLKYSKEEVDLSTYKTAVKAEDISIKYSDYRTSIYKYDSDNKNYLRYLNSKANVDLVNGKQYTVKNIIVYGVKHTTYTSHNYYGYQKLDNIGNGEGYYITDGYAIPITWSKLSEDSKTVYKIKETGETLVVNMGNTYIQIYPSNGGSLSIK